MEQSLFEKMWTSSIFTGLKKTAKKIPLFHQAFNCKLILMILILILTFVVLILLSFLYLAFHFIFASYLECLYKLKWWDIISIIKRSPLHCKIPLHKRTEQKKCSKETEQLSLLIWSQEPNTTMKKCMGKHIEIASTAV